MTDRYRLIIFDWDGTVLDSFPRMVASFRQTFAAAGLPDPDPDVLRRVAGKGWFLAANSLFPDLSPERHDRLRTVHRQVWARGELPIPDLLPGAEALLRDLHQRGYLLAVASARSRASIENSCEHFGLRGYFHGLCGARETRYKPSPAMVHALLEQLDVAPEQVLLVGDNEIDLQMAANAGVDAAGVETGGLRPPEIAELGATLVLRDLTEHATQRRFVYSHQWRQWDLVMWDNRALMHRARPFDAEQVRDMHRTTVADYAPTLEQPL